MNYKFKIFFISIILLWGCSPVFSATRDRPGIEFHTHPLMDMAESDRTIVRGEVLEVTRKWSRAQEGLVKIRMVSGKFKRSIVHAKYFSGLNFSENTNVLISYIEDKDKPAEVFIEDYDRTGSFVLLILLFIGLVLVVGGRRSFYALGALGCGVLAVKYILIPAVISGASPILFTVITVGIVVGLTMLAVHGFSKEALVCFSGAMGGILAVLILGIFFYNISRISGVYMEELQLMKYAGDKINDKPVSFFRNFLTAVLVLGSSGVIMDAAMSITSSMKEAMHQGIKENKKIVKVGQAVKKDIILTMANTLMVAFIGASLGQFLVQSLHVSSIIQLINMEFFHVQFYYVTLGSIGFILGAQITEKLASHILD
ncbi:MAG: YibE/F family protein [Elusimicrobiota bacterium]